MNRITFAAVALLLAAVGNAQDAEGCWNEVCVQYQNFCPMSQPVVCVAGPLTSTCSSTVPSFPQCSTWCNISACGGTATPQPALTPIPNQNPTICHACNATNGCPNDPVNPYFPCPSDGSAPFLCTRGNSEWGCSSSNIQVTGVMSYKNGFPAVLCHTRMASRRGIIQQVLGRLLGTLPPPDWNGPAGMDDQQYPPAWC